MRERSRSTAGSFGMTKAAVSSGNGDVASHSLKARTCMAARVAADGLAVRQDLERHVPSLAFRLLEEHIPQEEWPHVVQLQRFARTEEFHSAFDRAR